jgi:hypothetical protein
MAFSFPADQRRLRSIFNLDRNQLYYGSVLHSLMKDAEAFDAQESETTVAEILVLMAELDTDTTGLLAQFKARSEISSLSITGEYSVSYGAGGKNSALSANIQDTKSRIRTLLDPDSRLQRYSMSSRVIPS